MSNSQRAVAIKPMVKNILIIGGTSGIGLALATHYSQAGHKVCVTGRKDPYLENVLFFPLCITASSTDLSRDLDSLVKVFPGVHTLVYSAGFLQRSTIDDLDDDALLTMSYIGLVAPMLLAARLKPLAPTPLKIMLVTSSSQYTPRALEPAYAATKAGLGMLGASLARDSAIGKVLVVAPAGTRTPFWDNTQEDTSTMLDPDWAAQQIVELSGGAVKYRYAKLQRNPARVEVVETLDNKFNSSD